MEIRFRVWDGEKMWYPQQRERTFAIGQQGEVVSMERTTVERLEYLLEKDEDFVAMLSTGLKDTNGKEIWEGDIVQYKQFPSGTSFQSVVAYRCREFKPNEIGCSEMTNLEVIGNIHENPELLEEVAK